MYYISNKIELVRHSFTIFLYRGLDLVHFHIEPHRGSFTWLPEFPTEASPRWGYAHVWPTAKCLVCLHRIVV